MTSPAPTSSRLHAAGARDGAGFAAEPAPRDRGGHRNVDPTSAAVVVEGIEKRFGSYQAVQPTSFTVPSGALATLVGPSGSGKTTILRMIAGFETPTAGRVLIAGQDVTPIPPYKRNLGFVFQQYALFPHLTVAENIAYPLRMRGVGRSEIRERVAGALGLVRLDGLGPRYPSQLSGGQQQRVAIARAIVFRPPVLLMDEPMSALDKRLRDEMQYEIRSLQKQLGITTIAVTHDQTEALVMSDVMIVLNKGRIEQSGPPQEVYRRPATEFVASFVGESNILKGRVSLEDGEAWLRLERGPRLQLPARRPAASGEALAYVVRPESIALSADPRDGAVNLRGTIIESGFVGDALRLRVDVGWPSPMVVKLLNRHGNPIPVEGQGACVSWSATDATIIPP